jgi:hypothetical protein
MEKQTKYIEYENNEEYNENEILEEEEQQNYIKIEEEEDKKYNISLSIYESIKNYIDENCLPIGEFLSITEFYSFIDR